MTTGLVQQLSTIVLPIQREAPGWYMQYADRRVYLALAAEAAGVAIILVILLAPEGIYWRVRDLFQRPSPPVPQVAAAPVFAAPRLERRPPSTEPILEVRGISKSYGGLKAVQDVSFDVGRGEILGVIGPNGAGKTTLFKAISGTVTLAAGRILFEDRKVFGAMTVLENLIGREQANGGVHAVQGCNQGWNANVAGFQLTGQLGARAEGRKGRHCRCREWGVLHNTDLAARLTLDSESISAV